MKMYGMNLMDSAHSASTWLGSSTISIEAGITESAGERPDTSKWILQGSGSIVQVDGYTGCNPRVTHDRTGRGNQLAICWAHACRKLIEIIPGKGHDLAGDSCGSRQGGGF